MSLPIAAVIAAAAVVVEPAVDEYDEAARLVFASEAADLPVGAAWTFCGDENAYYSHQLGAVVLCEELRDLSPGVVRFVVGHELAHARFDLLNVPYTGSEESAADELAAVLAISEGRSADVLEAAVWVAGTPDGGPDGTHPHSLFRARYLACLAVGVEPTAPPVCKRALLRATEAWARVLSAPPLRRPDTE